MDGSSIAIGLGKAAGPLLVMGLGYWIFSRSKKDKK